MPNTRRAFFVRCQSKELQLWDWWRIQVEIKAPLKAQKRHSTHNTHELNGPEDLSVISNSGEVDYLKVAVLKRMKNVPGSQAPLEHKKRSPKPLWAQEMAHNSLWSPRVCACQTQDRRTTIKVSNRDLIVFVICRPLMMPTAEAINHCGGLTAVLEHQATN